MDRGVDRRWQAGDLRERGGVAAHHRGDERDEVGRGGPRRRAAGQQLVGDDAPRELIGAAVDRDALHLLGGHVLWGAGDRGGALVGPARAGRHGRAGLHGRGGRRGVGPRAAGDPEVEDLQHAVAADHDVLGLDVAVDEAAGVGEREGRGDVGEPREAGRQRGVGGDQVAQRAAVDQLHRQECGVVDLADVEDRHDVRVVERGGGPGLADQPRRVAGRGVGVGGAGGGVQDLERDASLEPRVVGAVDLAHAARAEQRLDRVTVEARTDRQHRRRWYRIGEGPQRDAWSFAGRCGVSVRGTTSAVLSHRTSRAGPEP